MTSFESVFGPESPHLSEKDAVLKSRLQFVRSRSELGVFEAFRNPTGHVLTAWEAYQAYGLSALEEALEYGSAILLHSTAIETTLHSRVSELGLKHSTVAREAGLQSAVVQRAQSRTSGNQIRDLERIGFILGLDELRLGHRLPGPEDAELAVRLKTLRPTHPMESRPLSAGAVVTFAHAASVIRTQCKLQNWLGLKMYDTEFEPSNDYGNSVSPPYKVGYSLADDVRSILGFGHSPIESMRNLVEVELGIPVVQAKLPQQIAGATIAIGHSENREARGIVLNTDGANKNVWVRRATLAHELGHLLFDPIQRLQRVRVDTYQSNEIDPECIVTDGVEQRANAFAIALLAPMEAVRDMTPSPIRSDSVKHVMSKFGISYTAARYHIFNAHNRVDALPSDRLSLDPSDEHKAAEDYTLDYLPIKRTPDVRRGRFAGIVGECYKRGFISVDSATQYMNCDKNEFADSLETIRELYSLTDTQPATT